MCDILQSGGIVNGPYVSLDKQTDHVELVFCNPDLTWRSDFEKPRLGQGAFITAFQAVYKVCPPFGWRRHDADTHTDEGFDGIYLPIYPVRKANTSHPEFCAKCLD
jgi:hypothetical protein